MSNIYKDTIFEIKAVEYNCSSDSFLQDKNYIISESDKNIFKMITFGVNALILTSNSIHSELKELLGDESGLLFFDAPKLCLINTLLLNYNLKLGELYDCFIPGDLSRTAIKDNSQYEIKKLSGDSLKELKHCHQFDNALCLEDFEMNELAFAAYDGPDIVSIAGVSSNTDKLWAVGVDTVPQYRNKGLAALLVNLAGKEVVKKDKIPIYPTWYSNIGSRTVAINAGFKPGYVEIDAEPI